MNDRPRDVENRHDGDPTSAVGEPPAGAFVPCVEVVELLTDYLEGVLASARTAELDEHLSVCDGCSVVIEQWRTVIDLAGGVAAEDVGALDPALALHCWLRSVLRLADRSGSVEALADSAAVATIVFLHAHPDDEVISTGGTSARAAAEGHRTVLVVATDGRFGETPDDLADGETIVERRRAEAEASAAVLGFARVEWLGYRDSGMTGWEANADPESFWQASVDDAGERLAKLLAEEGADALVVYDWHGNYGHPDHVQVHRVGHRAAELAGTPMLLEATFNRDQMIEAFQAGMMDFDPETDGDDGNPVGMPAAEINYRVDVTDYVDAKRSAIACHRSQTTDAGGMTEMPIEAFRLAFGIEWFIRPGHSTIDGPVDAWPFDDL